ncbi:synaptosomal-associated protein 25-B-like [Haemaphysalis longicornis]
MDGETDEQRFLRELNRLLAEPEPDEADVDARLREQEQRPAHDPSIEATRSLLRAVQEAQGVGIRTVVSLDAQGQQLDNVERALDDLAADLGSAEADLSEEIGHRLDTQNEQTGRLTASASSSEERVRKASKRSEEILKDE